MKYDIDIDGGNGFYNISGQTKRGKSWMSEKVQGGTPWGAAPCDDTSMTQDIADGALQDGLTVRVNGRKYLGDGKSAKAR